MQDFERDCADLLDLLAAPAHVVAHSYGALGALLAAACEPSAFRSLTVVEPPLFAVAPDHAAVAALRDTIGEFARGRRVPRERLRDALDSFGELPSASNAEFGARLAHVVRLLKRSRPAEEARPRLEAIAAAGLPTLVASGRHHAAAEEICDRIATATGGRRIAIAGAGHLVPSAAEFNVALERFLGDVERASADERA